MGNERLLIIREQILKFYKTYERWLIALSKYLGVVWILALLTNLIGYFEPLNKSYMILGIAFISMVLPTHFIVVLIMAVILVHLTAFNLIVGGITLVLFVVAYFGYIRLYPKESILIIMMILAVSLRMEYLVPILAALFCGYSATMAIGIGLVATYFYAGLSVLQQSSLLSGNIQENLDPLINLLLNSIVLNPTMLGKLVIFTIVFSIVYFVRKQSIDYAPYIAIGVGAVMNLLGFGLAALFLELPVQITWLVVMTIVSAIIAVIVQFFAIPLDYSRTENVQYEDEENYYYVKIVPKLSARIETKKVEQIYTMNANEEEEML